MEAKEDTGISSEEVQEGLESASSEVRFLHLPHNIMHTNLDDFEMFLKYLDYETQKGVLAFERCNTGSIQVQICS